MTISLKKLVQFVLAAYCGLLLILFVQYEVFEERVGLVSLQGILLTVASVLVCAYLVGRCNRRQLGMTTFLLLLVGIYYWIPVLNLIIFPSNFMRAYPLPYRVDRSDIDLTFAFLALAVPLSLLALMTSRHAGATGPIKLFRSSETALRIYWGAAALMLISAAIDLYRYLVIGQGRFGVDAGGSGMNWIFYLFASIQLACMIFFGAGIGAWPLLGKRGRQVFVILVCVYVVTRLVTGSKGGIYDVAVFGAGALLLLSDFDRIKVKLLVYLFAGAIVLLPLSFMAGFASRAVTFSADLRSHSIGLNDIYDQSFESFGDKEEIFAPVNIVRRMAARVNALDVLVVIVRRGSDTKLDFWDTVPKAIVNLLMPGDPFADVLPSSRLFLVEYGGQAPEEAFRIYHTDVWYLYGLFVPFVGVAGALVMIFISLKIFAALYYRSFHLPDRRRFYFQIFFLYCFYWFIVNLGIDEWVGVVAQAVVNLAFFIVAIHFFGRLASRRAIADSLARLDGARAGRAS